MCIEQVIERRRGLAGKEFTCRVNDYEASTLAGSESVSIFRCVDANARSESAQVKPLAQDREARRRMDRFVEKDSRRTARGFCVCRPRCQLRELRGQRIESAKWISGGRD